MPLARRSGRHSSLISALRAAGEGLSWEVFQAPLGSGLFEGFARRAPDLFPEITAAPMAAVARLELDSFLLHAQRADDDGNVEVLGGRGTDQPMAFAAKRVLVTVDERVRNGQLGGTPGGFLLPRSFVTGICVAPLGAYPTSCLPYYGTDYRKLHQVVQATRPGLPSSPEGVLAADSAGAAAARSVPANSPERILSAFARASARRQAAAPPVSSEPAWTIDELMACCIARTVDDDSILLGRLGQPAPDRGLPAGQAIVGAENGAHVVQRRPPRHRVPADVDHGRRVARLCLGSHAHGRR